MSSGRRSVLDGQPVTVSQFRHEIVPRLLATGFCSSPWVAAAFAADLSDRRQPRLRYQRLVFPPGGKATLMRRCPACRRMSPPNLTRGEPCADCELEAAWERFAARLRPPADPALAEELYRRWWHSGPTYRELLGGSGMALFRRMDARDFLPRPTAAEEGSAIDADDLADGPVTSDERPWGSQPVDARLAFQAARRRLIRPREGSGLHPGSDLVMLPERKSDLRKEISYYRRRKRVKPRARRYSQADPYYRAPEDRDPDPPAM
jgi:hypothetical protein